MTTCKELATGVCNNNETADRTLKDILCSISSFGVKVVLFFGDSRKTLPAVPRSSNACIFATYLI